MRPSALLFVLALTSTVAYSQPLYTVTDLGVGVAYAVNNAGQVTGFIRNGPSATSAFLYSNGVTTELGTLGGSRSAGYGINNLGQIVGYSYLPGDSDSQGFIYSGGVMTGLGGGGGAFGINDAGQITGNSGAYQAYLYENGIKTGLGGFTIWGSEAQGINSSGQITGYSWIQYSGVAHAFIYSGGSMTDLGTLGGDISIGFGINDAGQVTGQSGLGFGGPVHAFLYTNGVMADLGTLGGISSHGYAVNNLGEVTGVSSTGNSGPLAFIYDGVMTDLNTLIDPVSGWKLERGNGINDLGQIVGQGTYNGATHAFLLTPIPSAIPVPNTGALLLVGLGLLAGITRRAA